MAASYAFERRASGAMKCDACGQMLHGVERVALLVEGQVRVERDLCRGCRTEAIDGFLKVQGVTMGVGSRP